MKRQVSQPHPTYPAATSNYHVEEFRYDSANHRLLKLGGKAFKMSKDSNFTYIHFNRPSDADLFEDFCKDKLPDDEIYVPPHHQPINPEDEDDVVPDQHAAFGIQRATQKTKETAWKDLGLADLMNKGPRKDGGAKGFKDGSKSLPR